MSKLALDVWARIHESMRKHTSRLQYDSWLASLDLIELREDGVAILETPNHSTCNWLETYYLDLLLQSFSEEEVPVTGLEFRCRERDGPRLSTPDSCEELRVRQESGEGGLSPRSAHVPRHVHDPRTGNDFVLNSGYTFGNFVTGPCNRLPHAAALAVVESPGKTYNPLFIHGNVGLGKTHLMQAICNGCLHRDPDASILYLSCEEFVNQFIEAVERGELEQFRHRYRYLDLLVIDDIHFLANKERTQEEFFHTFNSLYNAQKQIVLSSDAPPVEIPTLEDRLVSRFKWGLVTVIESPAYETRVAIIKKKARLQGIELADSCLQFLAENLDSSIREIEGAITKVAGYARLVNRPITLSLVKEALRDLLSVGQRKVTIQNVIDLVCEHYDVKLSDLQSKGRKQSITFPRQVCMHLARRHTKLSLEEIGGYFGGRDHTTVLHADEKIRRMATDDVSLRNTLDRLSSKLRN